MVETSRGLIVSGRKKPSVVHFETLMNTFHLYTCRLSRLWQELQNGWTISSCPWVNPHRVYSGSCSRITDWMSNYVEPLGYTSEYLNRYNGSGLTVLSLEFASIQMLRRQQWWLWSSPRMGKLILEAEIYRSYSLFPQLWSNPLRGLKVSWTRTAITWIVLSSSDSMFALFLSLCTQCSWCSLQRCRVRSDGGQAGSISCYQSCFMLPAFFSLLGRKGHERRRIRCLTLHARCKRHWYMHCRYSTSCLPDIGGILITFLVVQLDLDAWF